MTVDRNLLKQGLIWSVGITAMLIAGAARANVLVGFGKAGRIYTNYNFPQTIFTGECPGLTAIGSLDDERLLVPKSLVQEGLIPNPQKRRRVRILNKSNGAYTDRKWEPKYQQEGLDNYRSQDFDITIGSQHSRRHFNLLQGSNNLVAIFYDGKKYNSDSRVDLSKYDFTVEVAIKQETVVRNRRLTDVIVECAANLSLQGDEITDENCPGNRQQVQYLQCPDGSGGNIGRQRMVQATVPGPRSSTGESSPRIIIVPEIRQ